MVKSSDVTPPPPTSLKPDINNSKLGIKGKITKMGNKEPDKAIQSEDDEGLLETEEDQVELRKSGDSDGKRCRVLFRYCLNHNKCSPM